jgi:methionyl-tRNA formyltransferase
MKKFAYFGYRKWAEEILIKLKKEGFDIKSFTIEGGEYREDLADSEIVENPRRIERLRIEDFSALFFCGWSWIVPKEVYQKKDCVCLHPSPLPKYRGGSPIQNQVLMGETESAVTLFKISEGIDEGPIYYQMEFSLEGSLEKILNEISEKGFTLTKKLMNDYLNSNVRYSLQDESKATICKRRTPEQSELTLEMLKNMSAKQIYDFIRVLQSPYPTAFIKGVDGEKVEIRLS